MCCSSLSAALAVPAKPDVSESATMRPRASRREMRAAPSRRAPSCTARHGHPEKIDISYPPAAFTNPSPSCRVCETAAVLPQAARMAKPSRETNAQRLSNLLEFDPVYDLTPG